MVQHAPFEDMPVITQYGQPEKLVLSDKAPTTKPRGNAHFRALAASASDTDSALCTVEDPASPSSGSYYELNSILQGPVALWDSMR